MDVFGKRRRNREGKRKGLESAAKLEKEECYGRRKAISLLLVEYLLLSSESA